MSLHREMAVATLSADIWAMPDARLHGVLATARLAPLARRPAAPKSTRNGRVAVIAAHGVLTQRPGLLSALGLGVSTAELSTLLRLAVVDPSVACIVLDIDSDGGSVYGLPELAAEIMSARQTKPVAAIANSVATSGAYWLAACCSEVYVAPGGEVGGIGIATAHTDASKALASAGISTTLISAGKYKVEGNPYGPLGADAKGFMQSRVDDYYGAFTRDVAKGRKVSVDKVRQDFGQGRALGASQAKAAGMVDGVTTLGELVGSLSRGKSGAGATARLQQMVALHQAAAAGI
jgi:capsid assembly protease